MYKLSYFKYPRTITEHLIYIVVPHLILSYEIFTDNAVIDIKRGDPLCYLRFNTHKKVKIEQIPFTQELEDYGKATTSLKNFIHGMSLPKMYERFRRMRRPKLL